MKRTISTIIFLLIAQQLAFSQEEKLSFTTYYFSDSGSNSVTTNALNLAKRLFSKTMFFLDLELDNVYVPPVDGASGATRPARQKNEPFEKSRGQIILGVEQGIDDVTNIAANFYHSQELDYRSNSVIGSVSREMFEKNTKLMLRGQFTQDEVGKILENGDLETFDKWTVSGKAAIGQILSPTTVLDLSYDLVIHNGYLSDPYRQVKVFDALNAFETVAESHPDTRIRHAISGKISHFLEPVSASISGNYRFYFDDWNVSSHTVETQFNKYVFEDLILRLNYRFYTQGAAEFWQERYSDAVVENGDFRTADYKLQSFNSNNFGLSLTYLLSGIAESRRDLQFLENASIEARYFRYFNTLDFSANIVQLNLNFGF